ncbi:hypothetical protein Poli38472_014246 [Pythium oligandrum]|uniref:SCP domain-containing protein n=1 Tax=Pythium oligandrum TaxID=41045 RepID=A0A8K1CJD7_PYTOL|nr:hypothetical protein Poli38472_014246 [Pythium oligandrum]|eukprot:TMW64129.1 hypothetical protein Poli38472_014246 [Pythium oligandrum]
MKLLTSLWTPLIVFTASLGAMAQQDGVTWELLDIINTLRAADVEPLLCFNAKLTAASQQLANEMALTGVLSTTTLDGSSPTERAVAQGLNTTGVSELVGAGYENASHAVAEWLRTPAYRAYFLSNDMFVGIGYAYNAAQTYKSFWVVDFANATNETCS